MIERTRDKIPIIRSQAVAALSRLQNPLDASDDVISQYLALLSNDSSVYVTITIR